MTPVPGGVCADKTWSFSSACRNLWAQHRLKAKIWFSEKNYMGGYDCTTRPP